MNQSLVFVPLATPHRLYPAQQVSSLLYQKGIQVDKCITHYHVVTRS